MMFKRLKNNKGSTLLENILTVVIVGVGLMGGMIVMQNVSLSSVNHDKDSIATLLAQEKLEIVLADNEFNGYDAIIASNYPNETLTGSYAGISRSVTITEVDPADLSTVLAGSGLKKISVNVSWGSESYKQVTLNTLVGDYQ